jgi:hypothetical protein
MRRRFAVLIRMGNSTLVTTREGMLSRLSDVVSAYRGLLRADERRLHEAMLEYERQCWAVAAKRAV